MLSGRSETPVLIVVDASAAIEWLLKSPAGIRIDERLFAPDEILYAPELLYVEVAQGLKRQVLSRRLLAIRAEQAIADLLDLQVNHFPHALVMHRVWELRDSLSVYDAVYVAMAETLEAPLLTCDAGIASAHGHRAKIELFVAR